MQRILKELNTEINRSANMAGTGTNANDLCNAYCNGIKFAIKNNNGHIIRDKTMYMDYRICRRAHC